MLSLFPLRSVCIILLNYSSTNVSERYLLQKVGKHFNVAQASIHNAFPLWCIILICIPTWLPFYFYTKILNIKLIQLKKCTLSSNTGLFTGTQSCLAAPLAPSYEVQVFHWASLVHPCCPNSSTSGILYTYGFLMSFMACSGSINISHGEQQIFKVTYHSPLHTCNIYQLDTRKTCLINTVTNV